ncbi:hypothetical protein [Romboutsia sp.]|uniref:hypothetical protein n=1 Tax=Romboutsia sp. TaxID=1965302 RepID=UPI003F2EF1B9
MKLKKKFIVGIVTFLVIPFIVGLIVNYTYDKLKNHSNANKSGFEVEFNLKIKLD